jgi:hypothetical protein
MKIRMSASFEIANSAAAGERIYRYLTGRGLIYASFKITNRDSCPDCGSNNSITKKNDTV